jgi:hypothetical protein
VGDCEKSGDEKEKKVKRQRPKDKRQKDLYLATVVAIRVILGILVGGLGPSVGCCHPF